ncbi:diguanylate cyclase [Marispirochaeta sp.]|uniref:diguanylate cyclase n=1 Tax=Marispirochaeta sp. TaxID=2038653 RepID=UPI0029C821C6|nr:diguanylate cyclase [Marispirochaeta sp.]
MIETLTPVPEFEEMAILIVDDVPANIQFLGKLLKDEGFKIAPASNGKKALEMIPRVKPDLVLMDVMMPEMNGFEACRRMKESAEMKDIPVIFLSARTETEDVIKGFKLGAADYIQKPFNADELLVRVRNHIELVRNRRLIIHYMDELGKQNVLLQQLAITDGLTGLYNHSHCMDRLQHEAANAKRYNNPLTVAMLDLDYFKELNDSYGHPFGDTVLVDVAEIIRSSIREGDVPGRYGGEEFILILPNTSLDGGLVIAERIRSKIESHTWGKEGVNVTISGGLNSLQSDETPSELIKLADDNLYHAKDAGRNRILPAL